MHVKSHTNVFVLFTISYLFEPSGGNDVTRDMNFNAYEDLTGGKVCSTDSPSQIVNKVRSKLECTLLCQDRAGCYGVNWKEPNTCEIYNAIPRSYARETRCIYFSRGGRGKYIQMIIFLSEHSLVIQCNVM